MNYPFCLKKIWLVKYLSSVHSLKTNIDPENGPFQKETIVFHPSIFRCELLVSGGVYEMI